MARHRVNYTENCARTTRADAGWRTLLIIVLLVFLGARGSCKQKKKTISVKHQKSVGRNKRAAPRARYNRTIIPHFHILLLYPSKTRQSVKFGFSSTAFAVRVLSSIVIEENVSHCNYNDLFQKLFLFFRPPFPS